MTAEKPEVCPHGHLKRSCQICELQAELAAEREAHANWLLAHQKEVDDAHRARMKAEAELRQEREAHAADVKLRYHWKEIWEKEMARERAARERAETALRGLLNEVIAIHGDSIDDIPSPLDVYASDAQAALATEEKK